MKEKSPNELILRHVNMSSLQNKFDALTYTIGNNIYTSHFWDKNRRFISYSSIF